jgi:hypothetical protein
MAKFVICLELDDKENETGRFQVVDEGLDLVLDTFDTEAKAVTEMRRLQAESDRDDKIAAEYLEWEKGCMKRHKISRDDLRVYLVNAVCI